MFRKVLVPIEFEAAHDEEVANDRAVQVRPGKWVVAGPSTVGALQLAGQMARGGEVTLVHATPDLQRVSMYAGADGVWFPIDDIEAITRSARKETTLVLEKLAERHCPEVPVHFHVEPGAPVSVIMDAVDALRPDAIVLAASGRGRVRRAVLGSVADKVIRKSPCPVVVVPADPEAA